MIVIILDQPVTFGERCAPTSLLSLPLGMGTLLGAFRERARAAGATEVWIVPGPARDSNTGSHERRSESDDPLVVSLTAAAASARVREMEPSDPVVILDARYWAMGAQFLRRISREATAFPGAVFGVVVGSDPTHAEEHVQVDGGGRVRRVRRMYQGVTQAQRAAIMSPCAILPASAMGASLTDMAGMRLALPAMGVLVRDVPLSPDCVDLTMETGYLRLSEEVLRADARSKSAAEAYSRLSHGVALGRGALVHAAARLVGPVVIQERATIEQGATVVGPAVIGAGAIVRRGAVVAQSVVCRGIEIPAGVVVRQRVIRAKAALNEGRQGNSLTNRHFDETPGLRSILGHVPDLQDQPIENGTFLLLKRGIDFIASLVVLIVLLPVFLVIAALIKLESRGPVFFVHEREGRGGRAFPCIKFRTMRSGAHRMQRSLYAGSMVDGPHFKMRQDPRVTHLGRYLRKSNLDELPQFINVLLGHMSLVGPRPSPFRENQYCVPWRRARLSVRPGISGLWQICRSYQAESDFQQWIYYDLIYVRHMSPWLDIKVIGATVYAVLGGKSAPLRWFVRDETPIADEIEPTVHQAEAWDASASLAGV